MLRITLIKDFYDVADLRYYHMYITYNCPFYHHGSSLFFGFSFPGVSLSWFANSVLVMYTIDDIPTIVSTLYQQGYTSNKNNWLYNLIHIIWKNYIKFYATVYYTGTVLFTIPYYAVLYYTTQYYATLHYTIFLSNCSIEDFDTNLRHVSQ